MNNETNIAFELLRGALSDSSTLRLFDFSTLNAKDWWRLFRLMQKNHVAALCYEVVSKAGAPRDVAMPWLAEYKKAVDWHRYQQNVQDEIIETMGKHGIETLVLKGTHTARHYPNPEVREFGDLDLYFYDRHDEADRIAREVLKVEVSEDSHHHTKYNYRGVTVESHYDFLNTHYPSSNRRYETLLKSLAGNTQLSTLNSQLSTFEVLFLLRHMAGHFAAGRITLRDLVDWAMTCNALRDEVDWALVEKTIEDYGMTDFVAVLNAITEQRLGIQLKSRRVEESKSHSVSQSLVEKDLVYGTVEDYTIDGIVRLRWKIKRWRALSWKRHMVYSDSECSLLLSGLTSHLQKPQSILHKM